MAPTTLHAAVVKPLLGGARLGRVLLGAAGIQASDLLAIRRGNREIFARPAWGFGSQPDDGEIFLDEWQQEELDAAEDDAVQWSKVAAEDVSALSHLYLMASGPLPESLTSAQLGEFMERNRFPLYRGFRFEFCPPGTGTPLLFQVSQTRVGQENVRLGLCQRGTQIQVQVGTIRNSGWVELDVTNTNSNVTFADIAGLEEIVEEIRDRLSGPLNHPEVFAAMGLQAERGILLHGPPGTGKTMLAKAIARECNANFLAVQGPELLSKWFGESEEGVRRMFERGRQLAPSLLFFDEIESLLPVRGNRAGDCGVMDRVVNQFLAEMDGFVETQNVTVLGATNRPELIDPAALRPGRLGVHIHIPLPAQRSRRAILALYLDRATPPQLLDDLARETEGFSGADLCSICRDAKFIALREVNYAHAVEIVERHLLQSLRHHRARLLQSPVEKKGYRT